jgi:hypothetical protein
VTAQGGGGWDEPLGGARPADEPPEDDGDAPAVVIPPGEVLAEIATGAALPARERLRALSEPPDDVIAGFVELWPRLAPERRRELLAALAALSEEDATLDFHRVCLSALLDPDVATRIFAVRGLWEQERTDYLRLLLDRLRHDEAPAVRSEVAEALGRFVVSMEFGMLDEEHTALLSGDLREVAEDVTDPDDVRARALEALGASSEEWVSELIADFYQSGSDRLRLGAVRAMGRNARDEWLPLILEGFDDEDPELRAAAATAAGSLLLDDAVDPLLQLAVDDVEEEVQVAAVGALGEIASDFSIRVLRRLAREGLPHVVEAVQEALAQAQMVPLGSFDPLAESEGDEPAGDTDNRA